MSNPITSSQESKIKKAEIETENLSFSRKRKFKLPAQFSLQRLWPPLGYLLLTLILTWPLVLNLSDGIIHFISSDHYQNLWNIWWFRTSLFEKHHNPYYTDVLFYPYRTNQNALELYFHTLQPALMLFLSPLSYLLGFVGTYNFFVLLSFSISGWAMYLLARYFTQNTIAAFVAGVLFDFCAYHLNILSVGQTNLMLTGTIPLYILFLHKSIAPATDTKKRAKPWLYPLLAVLTMTFAAYVDWYYPLYLLMYTFGLLLVQLVRERKDWRKTFTVFGAVIGSWLVLVSPLLLLTLHSTTDKDINYKPTFDFEVIHSSALFAFFQPVKDMRIQPGAWQQPFLGFTTLVLALVGIWFCRKRGGWWLWWIGLVLSFGVLSLGPYLRLNLTDDITAAINKGVPLPYLWLQNIPPISFSRSPSRFVVMVELALSILAAYGISGLLGQLATAGGKINKGSRLLLPAVGGLVITAIFCFEMQTLPWPVEKMSQPQIFQQIAAEPGDFAIMELPLTNHGVEDARRMYYQTIHHRPIAGGYIARKLTDYYRGDTTPFDDFFDRGLHKPSQIIAANNQKDAALNLLNVYNFRYLVIYKDDFWTDTDGSVDAAHDPQVEQLWTQTYNYVQSLLGPNSRVYIDENITVFRVPQAANSVQPVIYSLSNWYNVEQSKDQFAYQWAKTDPSIQGVNKQSQKVQLKLTAWAFQANSKFSVQVNGQEIEQLTLTGSPKDYVTSEFDLPKGEFTIVLHNLLPATSPHALDPKANDDRELTLAAAHIEVSPVGAAP